MPRNTGVYVAAGGASILAWSAIRGKNPEDLLHTLLQGKSPQSAGNLSPLSGISGNLVSITGNGSANALVAAAESGLGVPYKWGGGNANGWDCTGLVNDCMVQAGYSLPGGARGIGDFQNRTYTTGPHGPVSMQYFAWNSGSIVVPFDSMQPGDLACWMGHAGIVTGFNKMINAYTTGKPTAETPVKGWAFGPLLIRRIK